jgi:16S rRNA (cytosine1402-N4)-methyltransferase
LKFVKPDISSSKTDGQPAHLPVLLNEILEFFQAHSAPKKFYWDGTFGRGGHLKAVLNAFPELKAFAMDCDQAAIDFAEHNFAAEISAQKLSLARANYSEFETVRVQEKWPAEFDFMLLDLGVSSPQLDEAARGFSFYHDGPLDMRMDQSQVLNAEEVVNDWDEEDLYTVFTQLGEVRRPNRVLRAIVHDRKTKRFTTTRELASLIERVDGWHKKGMHPATKYFMGIRLAVNNELGGLRETLPKLMSALAPHGLLAVLTFHSLEDRIVKNIFKDEKKLGRMVNKKVVTATLDELKENSRSRSAKLRVFERMTDDTADGQQNGQTEYSAE